MKQQKATRTPAQKKAERRWRGGSVAMSPVSSKTPVTFGILAVTIVAYIAALLIGHNDVNTALGYQAIWIYPQPWRILTVSLTHAGLFHIGFNMLALWMIGRTLEPVIGPWRFLALYVISTIGGGAAVSLLAPGSFVVGASGAIFGLMGALVVIARRLGSDITSMLVVLGVNFVYGLIVGGISWQAHLGGVIAGAIVGLIYYSTRKRSQRVLQIILLIVTTVVLVGVAYIPALRFVSAFS
ncbi:rhomboid family intramembrane serine protease [Microbacterium sp. YY-03]|uniref:rhomboid family intramembrane serine protease n=1 Tax=Microbacterium sp. YY-03 TaxID=3421636 RepID=UPI003D17940E